MVSLDFLTLIYIIKSISYHVYSLHHLDSSSTDLVNSAYQISMGCHEEIRLESNKDKSQSKF